ncbi:hypothetical protein PHYSODRAFT_348256 [Phytophthora sojae]|uniref:1,3-beta-glucanosyltransferase n=1 Tax=Phytophthora sojae (strain P6497) TaxID=1094619 RepID=G5AAK6_PHYSP|nr:hypothetical protein PHYSODRAFT_348256 [Phytophthora sojae]EGZ07635.1 hypothetical protein PHYSODRAFT_348256 [Phytophthora sojae]|eukprot:XP_009537201.1 hypothetical protein PHYSODRAFT_348256 [Phytophthora sojae]
MAADAPPSPVSTKLSTAMKEYLNAKLEETPSMVAQLAFSFLSREVRERRIAGSAPDLEKVQNNVKSWRAKNKPDSMAPVMEICIRSMYEREDLSRAPVDLLVFCDSKDEHGTFLKRVVFSEFQVRFKPDFVMMDADKAQYNASDRNYMKQMLKDPRHFDAPSGAECYRDAPSGRRSRYDGGSASVPTCNIVNYDERLAEAGLPDQDHGPSETGANAVCLYDVDLSKPHADFMYKLRKYGMLDLTKFIRHTRAFIGGCSSTIGGCSSTKLSIPVGDVMADPDTTNNNRRLKAQYYKCRTDLIEEYENAEWYGLNTYQYCDGDVTTLADADGFSELLTDFTNYSMSIPVMLTEYGCVNPSFPTVGDYEAQRTWRQPGWLLGDDVRKVFTGGFAFEYSAETANSDGSGSSASAYPFTSYGAQNYELGYYSPEGLDRHHVLYNDSGFRPSPRTMTSRLTRTAPAPPDCPSGFSALADSTWESDSVEDESCPSEVLNYGPDGQRLDQLRGHHIECGQRRLVGFFGRQRVHGLGAAAGLCDR